MLSCSNDTTVKLWKVPGRDAAEGDKSNAEELTKLNCFYSFDGHQDYVRAMAYSRERRRLFSVSDDGKLIISDLNQQKIVQEYSSHKSRHNFFKGEYDPVYRGYRQPPFFNGALYESVNESCPTCVGASESGNVVVVGYSDDSLILHDTRSNFKEKI